MYFESQKAITRGMEIYQEGAHFVEIGGQSSNINANQISAETEWETIEPVISKLKEKSIPVSLDSFRPSVIQKAIESGVLCINDITGAEKLELRELYSAERDRIETLILMFSKDRQEKASIDSNTHLDPQNLRTEMISFFEKRIESLTKMGFSQDKIMIDPGMGFFLGEDPELSLEAIRSCEELIKRFKRVFVSVSRKSFIGNILGGIPPLQRGYGTLSAELELFEMGVEGIRTHDVLALVQAIRIKKAIFPEKYLS
jgi:dihydropteroate synthase